MARQATVHPSPEEALERTVATLVEAFDPERVYLFGSRARGDAAVDSDYDLMLVVRDSPLSKWERMREAYDVKPYLGIAVDVLVWTRDEFDTRLHLKASLPATIEREGRLLYRA